MTPHAAMGPMGPAGARVALDLNRALAAVVGIGATVVGLLAVVEAVGGLFGQSPVFLPLASWDRGLRGLQWTDPVVVRAAGAAVVIGAVLVVAEAWRRPPTTVARADDGDRSVQYLRHGLERRLRYRALATAEVVDATVRFRPAAVRVRLTTAKRRGARGRARELGAALRQELQDLGVRPEPRLRVVIRRFGGRVR